MKLNGEILRMIRLKKGLHQKELADLIGVTQGNISRYESDKIVITDEVNKRLIEAMEIDKELYDEAKKCVDTIAKFKTLS